MDLATDCPVVVLNAHHSGLGIARNLGPLGIRVIALSAHQEFPGNRSRWLEFRQAPDSLAEPESLHECLQCLGTEFGRKAVLFPTRDHDIAFINSYRRQLEQKFLLPFPSAPVLESVLNKERLAGVARSIGLDVPKSVLLSAQSDLARCEELLFPVMIKPVYGSQWRRPGIWEAVGRNKVVEARNADELSSFVRRVSALDPRMIVQERIPGGERNLLVFGSYCDQHGVVVAHFTGRKRLQIPAGCGTGVLVEALPISDVVEPSVRLLNALSFKGISEIEFKRDERSGRIYLIEINPRHWDQHRLGTIVGVNLSEAAYRDITEQPPRPMTQSHESALWVADPEIFGQALRALVGRAPASLFRELVGPRRTFAVMDRRDMRPTFAAVLNPLMHRIKGRSRSQR